MTLELARRLISSGTVAAADIEAALLDAAMRGVPFVRALFDRDPVLLEHAELELAREPGPAVRSVRAVPSLVASLPRGICERLFVVPVRGDPRTGTVDVAAVDVLDPHLTEELSYHLRLAVRLVRAPYVEVLSALTELRTGGGFVPERHRADDDERTRTDPYAHKSVPQRPATSTSGAIPLVKKTANRPAWRQKTDPGVGRGGPALRELGEDEKGEPILALSRSKAPAPPSRMRLGLGEPEALESLAAATSAEEVSEVLARAVGSVAERAVVFAVRAGFYEARLVAPRQAEGFDLSRVRVVAGTPNLIETALKIGHYLGVVTDTPAHAALRELLGPLSAREVYALPVRVSDRPALVVLAAGLDETTIATRRADLLARAAGAALERIVRTRKRR